MITLELSKEDATVLIKSLKIAKAKKKLEARHHLKRGFEDNWKRKSDFVKDIENIETYIYFQTK